MKAPPDLSRKAFNAALERNGFAKPILFWIADKSGKTPGVSYGMILHRTGKIARRATLASVIQKREDEIARKTVRDINGQLITVSDLVRRASHGSDVIPVERRSQCPVQKILAVGSAEGIVGLVKVDGGIGAWENPTNFEKVTA